MTLVDDLLHLEGRSRLGLPSSIDVVKTILTTRQFRAEPSDIRPGQTAKLIWNIQTSEPLRLFGLGGFNVFGMAVPSNGEHKVSPEYTRTYSLKILEDGLWKTLVSATVSVDDTGCVEYPLTPRMLEPSLKDAVDEILRQKPDLRRRSPEVITMDERGIHLQIRLAVSLRYWFDPKVDIDASISIAAANGRLIHSLTSFRRHANVRLAPDRYGTEADRLEFDEAIRAQVHSLNAGINALGYRVRSVHMRPGECLLALSPKID